MTFNILTDSTADLDEKWAQENKVELVGLTITLDDIAYETVGPNRLTSDRLLERMQEGSQPTTSQVNVGQFEEVFVVMLKMVMLFSILPSHQCFQVLIKVLLWRVT